MRRFAALFVCSTLALPIAHAQRPTGGVIQPDGDVAAGVGGHMVDVNPAGIGFGSKLDLGYTFAAASPGSAGQGHAFYLGLGVASYRSALALQVLNPPGQQDSLPVKFSWGHALRLSPSLSVGFAWHTFVADDDQALDGLDTWDLGIQVRPNRWMAVGMNITDLTTPVLDRDDAGVPNAVARAYEVGLSVRPGTERLTLTGVARLPERDVREDVAYGARLRWRLFGSIALIGRYDTFEVEASPVHQVMVGFADIGAFGMGLFGFLPDAGEGGGMAVMTRFDGDAPKTPEVFRRSLVVELMVNRADEHAATGFFSSGVATPWLDTLLTLRALAEDPAVDGILLGLGDAGLGFAQAAELRDGIKAARAAGKRVYAYVPVADTKTYSVAAAADRVYTAPAGGIALLGMSGESTYYGEALERLGVKAQFVAIGRFKSAPEAYTRRGPSDAAKAVTDSLFDGIYERLVQHIADGRGLSNEAVRALIDAGPYTAEKAKAAGLVDGIVHYDEFEKIARDDFGPGVRFAPAAHVLGGRDARWGQLPAVGVLYAVGPITDGESFVNPFFGHVSTGADTFIAAARALRDDPSVKAVVLRVDSPGGSVTAADAMWRELTRLAAAKPLIVSMGDIAASGGYYVAAPGRVILASPETITGSIGIFTGKFDLSGLFWTLGLDVNVTGRGKRAALFSFSQAWNEEELGVVRGEMQTLYDLFVARVAEGREGLDAAQVGALAEGRVWTGAQARACGLVDRPEGFLTAIDLAAREAGLGVGDYRVQRAVEGAQGGLPASPIPGILSWIADGAPAARAEPVSDLLARLASRLPALGFTPGTPLALLPLALDGF